MEAKNSQVAAAGVLASIPDVDAVDTIPIRPELPSEPGPRLLGQALSAKLLLAGTAFLLLAAVVPFLFTRKTTPTPAHDAAAGWKPVAPAAVAQAAKTPAEAAKTPAATNGVAAAPPAASDAADSSGRLRLIPPPTTSTAQTPSPPTPAPVTRDPFAQIRPPPARPRGRGIRTPKARPNLPMSVDTPAADTRTADSRYGVGTGLADRRIDAPNTPSAAGTDRYSAGRYGAEQPSPAGTPPGEPGVARLEGTIAIPPVRTTYDRARPSVY